MRTLADLNNEAMLLLQRPALQRVLEDPRVHRAIAGAFRLHELVRDRLDGEVERWLEQRGLTGRSDRAGAAARWVVERIRERRESLGN